MNFDFRSTDPGLRKITDSGLRRQINRGVFPAPHGREHGIAFWWEALIIETEPTTGTAPAPVTRKITIMTNLDLTTSMTIRDRGVLVADYVRHHFPDGVWRGDTCGCPDDRCIDHHHEKDQPCGCLAVLLAEMPS